MPNKKYTITMDENLMERIEQYADKFHIGRYAAISVLVSQALDSQQALATLSDFVQVYKSEAAQLKIRDGGQG